MSSQIIFYDLPSKQGTAWSLNPWKIRMVLNFKQIPYTTSWIEYPDLAPQLSSLGIPPNDRSAPDYKTDYAIPTITMPDGTHMMDSWPIAHKLEEIHPSPSLRLDDPIVLKVRDQIANIMKPLTGFVIPKVPKRVLNERSAVYFNETRKERFGMSLVEVEETMATGEKWEEARVPVLEAVGWLEESGGPYFLGETVSYADFIFVGMMHMIKRLDEDVFQRFLAYDPALPKLYDACKPWLEKDD
ncbi:hypothetical protein HBH92_042280 [Parastagonospora nodorum]|nr:hypothetical protein HBH50_017300 [Parastagonospora nodorum]KAH4079762.1 hypothetical protein HBH46_232610 [Parastagonospora nodorum]KAH4098218.1 hypothetical protein HBH48_030010 [Parastagonospora nodorum]KAH4180716.1 hypothetical protein HBH43_007870 [Parastagonospora nodorum]KAH4201493.1 hypothetical protein HBH42_030240 [Parastagonospora nodorum]